VDATTPPSRKVVSVDNFDGARSVIEASCGNPADFDRRMKMNWEEQSGKMWHTYGRHVLAIFVVVLMVHDVFGTHGFLAMRRKQQEMRKVSNVLDRLNKENALLEQDVQDLKSDPQTIRKIAREELGLAQPGEVIIRLPAPELLEPAAAKP
jgi:cell division protein FtsB